ncbi:unnamed protein product [Cuscuta epithymum]|uniref:Uncharacterized protein n=1 Tax=Cuscuta epithymum TaxID=186058 RepID=A0AAV0CIZ0_9ASTE|nr:unnamed protein product [Cuscuta epithymum]
MADPEHIDLEVKGLSLIDDASENDDFVFTMSPSPLKPTGTMDVQEQRDMDDKGNLLDILPEVHVSMEPERIKRKGKFNLRQSLAWDTAFFTDAGVLDADELSTIVKGAEKNSLPMIDEDVSRSTDTITTFESDNVPLEHLEAELFVDIRASIQRSNNKVSDSMIQVRKETSSDADSASKKPGTTLRNVPKPKLPPSRTNGAQALGMPKGQQKPTEGIQGYRKGVKPDITRVAKSITKSGDSTSSLAKLPKIMGKANPIPATMLKRASLSANQNKIDHEKTKTNTVTGKGVQTSRVFDSSNACKVLPRPTLLSKSSSMRMSGATKMQSSRTSTDSTTGSTLSDKGGKPVLPVARRKIVTKQPVSQPSNGSTHKTPSKTPLKNHKVSSGNSTISNYLMSSKINNSNVSPASSISEWSSVSAASSSCSNINGWSNKSRVSFDTSSCRSLESVVTSLDNANWYSSQNSEVPNQGTTSPRENDRKASSTNPLTRPSGLRKPSPKIGFFDGGKSVRTPNGSTKQGTAMPKIGAVTTLCSPSGMSDVKSKVILLNAADDPTDKQCFPSFASEAHNYDNKPNEATEHVDSVLLDTVNYNHAGGDQGTLKSEVCRNGSEKAKLKSTEHVESVLLDTVNNNHAGGDQGTLKSEVCRNGSEKANLKSTEHVDSVLLDTVNNNHAGGDQGTLKSEVCRNGSEKANLKSTIPVLEASRTPFADRNYSSGNVDILDFSMEAVVRGGGWEGDNSVPPEIDYRENITS